MTRLLFPDEGSRLAYRVRGSDLRAVANSTATLYSDAAGTVLADIRTYDGTLTPGPAIPGSVVDVDAYSRLPFFWGPDLLVDTLYAVVSGGPITPVLARFDPRVDLLDAAVSALQSGIGPYLVKTQNLADLPSIAVAKTNLGPIRRAAMSLSVGGSQGINVQSQMNSRVFVRPSVTVTRWRVKLANYDFRDDSGGGALTGAGIYYGPHALSAVGEPTGNFIATPTAIVSTNFAIPGNGTQYVSPWLPASTHPLVVGRDYVLSVGASGSAVTIQRGAGTSSLGVGGATASRAAEVAPSFALFNITFLDIVIEYEFAGDATVGLFIGDSLSEGQGGDAALGLTPAQRWPLEAASRSGAAATVLAISGYTSSSWTNPAQLRWTRTFDLAANPPDYAVIFLGANDTSASVPLATFQSNMEAIVLELRTLGIQRVYVATTTPHGLTGAQETLRGTYNTWLRSQPMGVDGVFDFDRVVRDSAAKTNLDADYNFGDGLHFNRAGYAALAQAAGIPVRVL